jgi:DNA modification methylase
MAFIDPPYNVPIDGFVSGNGDTRHREFLQGSGEMSEAQFIGFLGQALETLKAVLASGSICFVCIDWRHYYELQCAIRQAALELLNLCVWAKTTPGLGSFYRSQHELVAVLKVGNAEIRNNMALTGKRRNRSNLWTHRGMNSFGDDRDELVRLHPTVKPVALIADAIRDVSMRGEVVLDTFLGSGSTLMAAEETGRVCCGVELDPLYVDVAVRRWEQATRRDATLLESGETFAELSERRAETSPEIAHG